MSAPATGAAPVPGQAGSIISGVSGSPDGARAVGEGAQDTSPREGLRRTVSWADAQPDKDKSVGLVAVREFEPSEAGDTEDGYGYTSNRKSCCTVQ